MNNPSKRALSGTRPDPLAEPQRDSGYIDYEEGEGEYYEDEAVEEDAPEALADVQDYDDEDDIEEIEASKYEEDEPPRPSNMPIIAASLLGAVVVLSLILFLVLRGSANAAPNNGQIGGGTTGNSTTEMPRNGYLAPDFTLSKLDGSTVQLASFRGQKPVWLNFWATWCQPCRIEMPEMEQIYSTYKDKVEILGVDVAEDQTLVKSFLQQYNYSWTFALDPDNMAYRKYFSTGIPTHAFIKRDGVISSFIIGGLTRDMMDAELAKLLQ